MTHTGVRHTVVAAHRFVDFGTLGTADTRRFPVFVDQTFAKFAEVGVARVCGGGEKMKLHIIRMMV